MEVKFTKKEVAALLHRLGVLEYSQNIADSCYHQLLVKGRLEIDTADSNTRDLLIDCVENSTWVAVNNTGDSHHNRTAAIKTLRDIAVKLERVYQKRPGSIFVPEA